MANTGYLSENEYKLLILTAGIVYKMIDGAFEDSDAKDQLKTRMRDLTSCI